MASRTGPKPVAPIRIWREANHLTRQEAAAKIQVHKRTIIYLETWGRTVGKNLAAKVAKVTKQKLGEVIDQYERYGKKAA